MPQQHAPSRFIKVAETAPRHQAYPAFSRFMAALPQVSRFLAEHPKTSRFVFRLAHHIPVLDCYIPIAPPLAPAYNPHAQRPRGPAFRM